MTPDKRGRKINKRRRIAGNRLILMCEIAVIIVLMVIACCVVGASRGYVDGPGLLTQGEIDELLLNKIPVMTMESEPYYGELRGNLMMSSGSITQDDYSDSPNWNKNVLMEENGLIAQNDEWYFGPYDDVDYNLCAINKESGKKVKLADFEAVNINYYNNSLYFTNVEYSLEDSYTEYDIVANQKMGGKLYRIDDIDSIDEKTNLSDIVINEMGKPGYAYFKVDVNEAGVYTLIVNTETEDDRTGYVRLDENGEQAGVILAPAGENIVTYVEKDGYAYIEIMIEDESLSGIGERYIICVDRDHGSGEVTRINGTSPHYSCGQVIFQSTEDMYLYAVDDSHHNAYVISQYPVSTFTVFGNYIDAVAANKTHNSLRIGKSLAQNPFSCFCMLDVNGWTNYISVSPKALKDDDKHNKKDERKSDIPKDDNKEDVKGGEGKQEEGEVVKSGEGDTNGQNDDNSDRESVEPLGNGNKNSDSGVKSDNGGATGDNNVKLPIADINPDNYKEREKKTGSLEPLGEPPKLFDDEDEIRVEQNRNAEGENASEDSNIKSADDEPDGLDPTLVATDDALRAVDEYINYVKNKGIHISGEPKYSAKGSKDFENKYFQGNTIREYMVENFGILGDVKKYKGDKEKAERELKDGTADFMLGLYSELSLSYEILKLSSNGRKAIVRINQYNHLDLNGISEQKVRELGEEYKNSGKYSINEWAEDDAMYRVKATLWMLPQLLSLVPCNYTFDVLVTYDERNKVWNIAKEAENCSIEQIFLPEEGKKFEGSLDEISVNEGSGDKTDLTKIASGIVNNQKGNSGSSVIKTALKNMAPLKKRELKYVHKMSAYEGNPYKRYIMLTDPDEFFKKRRRETSFNDNIKILVNKDREIILDRAKELIKSYEEEIKRLKNEENASDEELEYERDRIECLKWAITQINLAQGNTLTKVSEKIKDFWQAGQDFAYMASETKSKQMIADEKDSELKYKNKVAMEELMPAITEIMYYGRFGEELIGNYEFWDYKEYYYGWE